MRACRAVGTRLCRRGRRLPRKLSAFFGKAFADFRSRLAAVAGMAQGLQVVRVCEQSPITAMRRDVINIGRSDAKPAPCAVTAKRLAQKLIRTQTVAEDRQHIPAMPACGLRAAPLFGLMLGTVAVARQNAAANMSARFQGFYGHGLSPPDKTKTPEPFTLLSESAQARWLRLIGSIFTTDSRRQFLHQTAICLPSVSGNSRNTFCLWQMGHSRYPSLVVILSQFFAFCNTFAPLLS